MYHARLYAIASVDLTLALNQPEYAIAPGLIHVTSATFYNSAGSWTPLVATNIDYLDNTNPTWRDQDSGQPFQYYEDGNNIGLWVKPSLATGIGGYPKVTVWYTAKNVTGAAVALPDQPLSYDAWVMWMLEKYCRQRHPDLVPSYRQQFSDALNDLINYQQARLVRNKPEVEIPIPMPQNR